jgi:hypothetical protein
MVPQSYVCRALESELEQERYAHSMLLQELELLHAEKKDEALQRDESIVVC